MMIIAISSLDRLGRRPRGCSRRPLLSLFALLLAWTGLAGSNRPAPLFKNLGNHHHPISTTSPRAQRYFDQGLTLLYGFNHAEAIRSFRAAARLDPSCAMAWWGVAYAYGPNINAPMTDEAVPLAWDALQNALRFREAASPREAAYVTALTARYRPEPLEDRSALDQAYAEAMGDLSRSNPDDLDAATLYVEAVMDTMPWDYWTEARRPKPATAKALETLRAVLGRNPEHPGALHLYIHALESGPRPELGIPSADRLRHLVPDAGHLVHMPSHIYVRVGDYHAASEANERAVKADKSYINQCKIQGYYPGLYYPHNLHFLWYTTAMEGRRRESLKAAQTVAKYAFEVRCGSTPVIEAPRFRHLPLLVHARFGQWGDILEARPPAEKHAFDRAMWHYARGLAFAAKQSATDVERELREFRALASSDRAKALETPFLPVGAILEVADRVLEARSLGAQGDGEGAIRKLRHALEAQEALPYMEPPYWYYPVRQTLGAALLSAGRNREAEEVFREDLKETPRNGWALFGLAESLRRQGKNDAATSVQRELHRAWQHADVDLDLSWF